MKSIFILAVTLLLHMPAIGQIYSDTFYLKQNETGCIVNVVSSAFPSDVVSNASSIVSANWTSGGSHGIWETYLSFGLGSLPSNAIINNAAISFDANTSSTWGNPGSPTLGNDNASYIRRIQNQWNENTTSWVNKPLSTTVNQVVIPQSTSTAQNYASIDITNLVQDIVSSGVDHGFCITPVQTLNYYNSQIFHSCKSVLNQARVIVNYSYPTAIVNHNLVENIKIFKNDNNSIVVLCNDEKVLSNIVQFDMLSINGQKIIKAERFRKETGKLTFNLNSIVIPEGIYAIYFQTKSAEVFVKKISL